MRVLYLAHKYRDKRGPFGIVQNVHAASLVAVELWNMGAAVICPGMNTFLFDGAAPDDVWLKGDLAIINRCDGVVMHPSWIDSSGAKDEANHSDRNRIPVWLWPEDRHLIKKFIDEDTRIET